MVESVVEVVGDVPGLGGFASPYLVDGSLLSAEMGSGAEAVLVVGIENDHPLPGLAGSGGTGDWGDGEDDVDDFDGDENRTVGSDAIQLRT